MAKALALLVSFWCPTGGALDLDVAMRDFTHTTWTDKQGAPSGIKVLAQAGDGYLYLGHYGGLSRFDGLRFERIALPSDIPSAAVMTMFVTARGSLWIGFTFGGAVLLEDGRMTAYLETDGLPPGSVKAFAEEADGTIWAATTAGLARLEGRRWKPVGAESGLPSLRIDCLFLDSTGTLWVSSSKRVFFREKGQEAFVELLDKKFDGRLAIAESPSGDLWAMDARLHFIRHNARNAPRAATSTFVAFDRQGALWTKTPSGVHRAVRPEKLTSKDWKADEDLDDLFNAADGLGTPYGVDGILEDRDGNIWVVTGVSLERFSERSVAPVLPSRTFPNFGFVSDLSIAAGVNGSLWAIDIGGSEPWLLDHGRVSGWKGPVNVTCMASADDGSTWFGGPEGLWRLEAGHFKSVELPEGLGPFDIQAIATDASGALWISVVRSGVFRRSQGRWSKYGGLDDLPQLTAITLSTDADGSVWFGYTGGRVAVVVGNVVKTFDAPPGHVLGNVTAIYGRRTKTWVGGEFGLAVFDREGLRPIVAATERVLQNITGIVETMDGDLWLNAEVGIVHVVATELRQAMTDPSHTVRTEVFGALDGFRGSSPRLRPLPTLVETSDHRLYFSSSAGLFSIDPGRVLRNRSPPHALIKSITVEGTDFAPAEASVLARRTTALRIDYVAPSLTMAEKVRYRYKLIGVDQDWQDAGTRREAFYTNLKPGSYRFHVIASNDDGLWNEDGATLGFTIPPTFVQTNWFIALCFLSLALLIWLLVRLRVQQLGSRMRLRLEERLAERERIARELHDTLLQSTQGVILKFRAVANGMADGADRSMLERTLERANDVMSEGRDRVLDLRVPVDSLDELPEALATAGGDLADSYSSAFDLVVEGSRRLLDPRVTDALYQIGREALINAFRHARAKTIEVQIVYANDKLGVRIRDDGRGLDQELIARRSQPDHWGLKGMAERAEALGARLEIWSRPAAGTEIRVELPAEIAYPAQPGSAWSTLRRLIGGTRYDVRS